MQTEPISKITNEKDKALLVVIEREIKKGKGTDETPLCQAQMSKWSQNINANPWPKVREKEKK